MTPRELVIRNLGLVSLPDIAMRVNAMLNDPHYTAADVAELIARDAALSARLLRIVNSPYYGLASQVESVALAVTVLGTRQLRDLVLATTVIRQFNGIPVELVDMATFWRHSLACAVAAREIANRLEVAARERYFLGGLLHDIGKLVMWIALPERSRQVLQQAERAEWGAVYLERAAFGFDHAEVGAELLRHWRLPEALIEPVAWHHMPQRATRFARECAAVHLANAVAGHLSPIGRGAVQPIEPQAWRTLGLPPDIEPQLRQDTARALAAVLPVFYSDRAA